MTELRHFKLPRGGQFAIPADWWIESGMDAFECRSDTYRFAQNHEVLVIPVAEIHPRTLERRQHLTYGGFDRERMIRILRGIASNSIRRIERPLGAYRYRTGDGTHRFYASVAAGFRCVPTLLGWDPETEIEIE